MSLTELDASVMGRAERQFRAAFARLKEGKPQQLPKGSKVSQNNVAREAGVLPSALRRKRFPKLVEDIAAWNKAHDDDEGQVSTRQILLGQRSRNKALRADIDALKVQRDDALNKLVEAEATIVKLIAENERLQAQLPAGKVSPLRPALSGRPEK